MLIKWHPNGTLCVPLAPQRVKQMTCLLYLFHAFYADTEFLLRFLRYCKFSQLEARKRLETYLTSMTKYANYIMDIDMTQKGVMDVVKGG